MKPSPLQSPEKDLADINASPPKFDVVLIVGHRVLDRRGSEACLRKVGRKVPGS